MKRYILTGARNRGKTSFCRRLAAEALERGMSVTGILSLKEMEGDRVLALWASDCREEEERRLARFIPENERPPAGLNKTKTPSWGFIPEAFIWGNTLIAEAPPADLFILDEAGPLEFDSETGLPREDRAWTAGMERMDRGIDETALIVVRPALVDRARQRWPGTEVLQAPDCRKQGQETDNLIKKILGW